MLSLFLLLVSSADAKCYDGGGNFKVATWPRCHEPTDLVSVYSGLSEDGQFVKLGLHVQNHSEGWSAIGFSGNGGMKGASQIVVRVENDKWVAEDRFSLDYVTPTLDPEQNVRLLFVQDNGVNTSWGVLIPKDSCDENDYATENVSRSFLWALGASHTFNQHMLGSRGVFHANLISYVAPAVPLTDVTVVNLKMANVPVVSATDDGSNPYICSIFDLREVLPGRNFSGKVHVAKFSPYLDPNSSDLVHHMLLYGCTSNNGFKHGTVIKSCQSMVQGCFAFKWVWAVGGEDFQFPDNVGMPFGDGLFFLVLQMHYYNPTMRITNDTSGVALSFTAQNRAIDAGFMQLNGGTSIRLRSNLPANTSRFALPPMMVPSICTSEWPEPLNVVGAFHHMHMLGVHERIEVARNGKHLGLMRRERRWDFKHQGLEEPLVPQLFAGDEIKLVCEYDTTGKMTETEFGENTNNEMCWAALMYYPAQSFTNAVIQPSPSMATLQAAASVCQVESSTYAGLSKCAEAYFNDPLLFFSGALASNLTAEEWCNGRPETAQASYSATVVKIPQLCPPTCASLNCTLQELAAYGQFACNGYCNRQVLCQGFCNRLGLSTFPDLSRPPVFQEFRTYCDLEHQAVYSPNTTFPSLPICVPKGSLTNEDAVQAASAAVLADQGQNMTTTVAPSTSAPSINNAPTSAPSTNNAPTSAPSTSAPSTSAPSTSAPSTSAPSTNMTPTAPQLNGAGIISVHSQACLFMFFGMMLW